MASSEYQITPRPPIRALLVAAVASLVGALLLVLALSNGWHVIVTVLAVVVLAAGLGLAVLALLTPSRRAVTLEIDDDGYTVRGASGEQSGRWAEVSRVTQSEDGAHVTIHHGPEQRNHLVFQGQDPALIKRILADVRAQLMRFSA